MNDMFSPDNHAGVILVAIKLFGHQSYLEIGCAADYTFSKITCPMKVGVDPVEGGTHRMTSDAFFAQNTQKFDAIFIDGDHNHKQVYKDAENALSILKPGGTLFMHDCNPAHIGLEIPTKCGTAWRAFIWLRQRAGFFPLGVAKKSKTGWILT